MNANQSVCTDIAAKLDSMPPAELLKQDLGVSDPTLSQLVVDERRLSSDALVACGKGDQGTMTTALSSLVPLRVLIDRRLAQVDS